MLRIGFIAVGCMLGASCAQHATAQPNRNNLWLGGYAQLGGPPWGGITIHYDATSQSIATASSMIGFKRTNANITDSEGNLQFSTNGSFLGDAYGDTLQNGTGLNPSNYTNNYPEGLHIPQASLILPKPGSTTVYDLIHSTIDDQGPGYTFWIYHTQVDMSLNAGVGAVVFKNQVLLEDTLNIGRITAVRHANGRDWWVLCHGKSNDVYYRFLSTPAGISAPEQQSIGVLRNWGGGQLCFSPQGNKFAIYWGMGNEDLEIFDFDRCTGLLSSPVHILINDQNNHGGVAFSPSGRYLYVPSIDRVYQFDMEAADLAGSQVTIAEWDGFYSPEPPLATLFDIAQLAPDGKIYIGTGNSTLHLHVINYPDSAGLACGMVQHGVELPRYFMNSLPNHPNYHLGPIDGSICDSLGIDSHVSEEEMINALRVFPNPSSGVFSLGFVAQGQVGALEVLDAAGRMVHSVGLPAWSTTHQVQMAAAPGMYHCRLRWGTQAVSTRIIITEP